MIIDSNCAQSKHIFSAAKIPSNENLLAGLNHQQVRAVTAPFDRAVLVLAGAGCGKTHTLVKRVGYCIDQGINAGHILALTFTRAAAVQMQQRVSAGGYPGCSTQAPKCTTFHALCLSMLREKGVDSQTGFGWLGYRGEPKCIDESQSVAFTARELTPAQREGLGCDTMGAAELLERLRVNPEMIHSLDSSRREIVLAIESRLLEVRRDAGLWDFADLLQGALKALGEWEPFRNRWTRQFREILVDEFQDTNPLQIDFLRELLTGGAHLYAVGDDDQAIYGFRGADVRSIVAFSDRFGNSEIIKMEINYRSSPLILRAANRVFRNKPQNLRKILQAGVVGLEKYPAPMRKHFSDMDTQYQWVVAEISRLAASAQGQGCDCALLFRTNEQKEYARKALEKLAPGLQPVLSTVHAAKGLEYGAVFVCGLEESSFPLYRPVRTADLSLVQRLRRWLGIGDPCVPADCRMDEEKRLFYVALTRARFHLYLLDTAKTYTFGRSRMVTPSRFLRLV